MLIVIPSSKRAISEGLRYTLQHKLLTGDGSWFVDVAIRLWAGRPRNSGSISGKSKWFCHHQPVQTVFGADPALYAMDTLFQCLKQPGRETDQYT
jgi:hypothetical protein